MSMETQEALKEQAQNALLARGYVHAVHDHAEAQLRAPNDLTLYERMREQLERLEAQSRESRLGLTQFLEGDAVCTSEQLQSLMNLVLDCLDAVKNLMGARHPLIAASSIAEDYWTDDLQRSFEEHAEFLDEAFVALTHRRNTTRSDEVPPGYWDAIRDLIANLPEVEREDSSDVEPIV